MRSQNGACKVRSTHPHAKQKKKALEYVKAKEKIRHMALCEFMVPKCCAISHQASESSLTTFEAGQHHSEAKQIAVSWPWSQVQGSQRSSPSPVTASLYRSTTDVSTFRRRARRQTVADATVEVCLSNTLR
nr:hypothetical protein Iba_chr14bCG9680 [Ipomoea batatas]